MDQPGLIPLLRRSLAARVAACALLVVAMASLTAFLSSDFFRVGDAPPSHATIFLANLISWSATIGFLWAIVRLRDRIRARRDLTLRGSLALDALLMAAYAGGVMLASRLMMELVIGLPRLPSGMTIGMVMTMMFVRSMLLYAIAVLGMTSLRQYRTRRNRERDDQRRALREERLEKQLTKARLDALRMQVHPHFLFNALHAIGGLVLEGERREAHRAIASLATLLRRSFRHDEEPTVAVREEIELLEEYLALEQIRLGERLRHLIDVASDALDQRVPPLLLLPVVENAIRHGIAPLPDGGTVRVAIGCTREHVAITITDDGAGYTAGTTGDGVGLTNCIDKIATMYGDEGSFDIRAGDDRGTCVSIRIPRYDSTLAKAASTPTPLTAS